jgi:hypothetical protein
MNSRENIDLCGSFCGSPLLISITTHEQRRNYSANNAITHLILGFIVDA